MLSGKGGGVAQTTRRLAQKQPSFKECVIIGRGAYLSAKKVDRKDSWSGKQ